MGNPVCVDTQILIWGIKREASEGQALMIERAVRFLQKLEETKTQVILPSVVIGELLVRVPEDCHQDILGLFTKNFMLSPFDARAAFIYSQITRRKMGEEVKSQLEMDPCRGRNHLKADRMIIATAVAHGAICIYSNDDHIRVYSEGFINYQPLPISIEQGNLFDRSDLNG